MKFLFADNGSWNTLSIHIKWRLKCCKNEKHFMLKTWRPFYISIVWMTRAIFKAGRLHFFPSHLCCCILFAFSNEISVHLICFWWKKRKTCFAALFFFTRQLYLAAHAILVVQNPCMCPRSNYSYHKCSCRQVVPYDFPFSIWICLKNEHQINIQIDRNATRTRLNDGGEWKYVTIDNITKHMTVIQ